MSKSNIIDSQMNSWQYVPNFSGLKRKYRNLSEEDRFRAVKAESEPEPS